MKTTTDAHVYRDSPVGLLMLAADDRGRLSHVEFAEDASAAERSNPPVPAAGSHTVSLAVGRTQSTIPLMSSRGVKYWPAPLGDSAALLASRPS